MAIQMRVTRQVHPENILLEIDCGHHAVKHALNTRMAPPDVDQEVTKILKTHSYMWPCRNCGPELTKLTPEGFTDWSRYNSPGFLGYQPLAQQIPPQKQLTEREKEKVAQVASLSKTLTPDMLQQMVEMKMISAEKAAKIALAKIAGPAPTTVFIDDALARGLGVHHCNFRSEYDANDQLYTYCTTSDCPNGNGLNNPSMAQGPARTTNGHIPERQTLPDSGSATGDGEKRSSDIKRALREAANNRPY